MLERKQEKKSVSFWIQAKPRFIPSGVEFLIIDDFLCLLLLAL